ncbi:MAG: AEC family transporter [Clostridium sp.]|nr:AEC family transporter [Clostridium sp.]
MALFNSLSGIFSIVLMIVIGIVLASRGWFSEESSRLITKLVMNVALPALMISTILENLKRSTLIHMGKGILIPILSMSICLMIAIILSKILKIRKERSGLFISMFFNSNTIFVGLPVNLALFGKESVPFVLLYYIANTTFFWTLGVYYISKSGNKKNSGSIFSKDTLRRVISPPLLGYIVALILLIFKIRLPKFIMQTADYMGGLTTPLSMIFIGICIFSVSIKNIKVNRDMLGIIAGRFIVSPITVYALTFLLPIPILMKKVFIIQSIMPVMTNSSIVAKSCGADTEYAAIMTVVTTVLSMLIIPFYMILLQNLF